jgi:hypothetical protein
MLQGPLSADFEEKRELASDIDTAAVDSLKVLDSEPLIRGQLNAHLRKRYRTIPRCVSRRIGALVAASRKNAPITSDMQDTHLRVIWSS